MTERDSLFLRLSKSQPTRPIKCLFRRTMVIHIELDLNQVVGFEPWGNLTESAWPTQWLETIRTKLCDRMNSENKNQLQLTLKHLLEEAREVS